MPRKTSPNADQFFLKAAIQEAKKAAGKTGKNPNVGAVIVKDGIVIARGRTQAFGGDHAEIDALKKAKEQSRGATMYVSLEPCCHYGKTPPCTKAIIAAGISEVVCGILDPNPLVAGKGLAELSAHGISIKHGILADEIRRLNEVYLCNVQRKRPFVILKTALSLDGKFAANDGTSQWITNEKARRHVHKLRANVDAILSSSRTINLDDALLTVRGVRGAAQPLRVVLDSQLKLSPTGRFATSASDHPSLLFYSEKDNTKAAALCKSGIELIKVKPGLDLPEVLSLLYDRGVNSILLEVGSKLASAFLKAGLIDKYLFYYGNLILGGKRSFFIDSGSDSIQSALRLKDMTFKSFGDSCLISAYPEL